MLACLALAVTATARADGNPYAISTFDSTTEPAEVRTRFERIVDLVERSNVPNLVGVDLWHDRLAKHRPMIEAAQTHEKFAEEVNLLFQDADISHFRYYTDNDWAYWHLQSLFGPGGPETHVTHVGLITRRIGDKWFVSGILEGSPTSSANIRIGDEILSVDGGAFQPVAAFRGKEGTPVILRLRRTPRLTLNIPVTPVRESLHQAMQRAMRRSIRVIDHNGLKFAYFHGWSLLGPGREYKKLLEMQEKVDGLLLDYRDGFGGTPGRAMEFFFADSRGDTPPKGSNHWRKPAVILTGDGTRSAKEIVVDAVQRAGIATLVGTATPGEVTAVGSFRGIGPDGLLMLPAHRGALEGNTTEPDILIERDIRYCTGADPQIMRAKEILHDLVLAYQSAN